MPRRAAWRAWSPYTICFALTFVSCIAQLPTRYFFLLVLPLMAVSFFLVRSSMTANTSSSFMMKYSSPSSLISWPAYLPNRIPSPPLTSRGDAFAFVVHLPLADREDRALLRLLYGRVRDDDPADILLAFVDALNKEAVV
jgi:hypothetical protein